MLQPLYSRKSEIPVYCRKSNVLLKNRQRTGTWFTKTETASVSGTSPATPSLAIWTQNCEPHLCSKDNFWQNPGGHVGGPRPPAKLPRTKTIKAKTQPILLPRTSWISGLCCSLFWACWLAICKFLPTLLARQDNTLANRPNIDFHYQDDWFLLRNNNFPSRTPDDQWMWLSTSLCPISIVDSGQIGRPSYVI